ncbi:DUF523 domain-containing protein [Pelagibius sp.]|uniref:DUF523 domain-containing protein n=1 Tax=Pelagibius sp. TaxID=1931238 RepID=UPI003BB0F20A
MKPRHELLLAHAPNLMAQIRDPHASDPLRVMLSGCLAGLKCGVDGTDYGMSGSLGSLTSLPTMISIPFCPEDHALGTPRATPDIHGGDGFDVIDGIASVLDQHGNDVTQAMLQGARAMSDFALENKIEIAILADISAACGSQVISDGSRFSEKRKYRAGVGVAAAQLLRTRIPVVAQRDFRTLGLLRQKLDPSFTPQSDVQDHHEKAWYRAYFGGFSQ